MALPRQVADKIKEVEALEQQLSGEQPKPSAQPQEELKPEVETPEAELPEVEETPKVEEAPKAEEPKVNDEEDVAVWKQKYKTLKGMYDAEVPKLHSQVKELKGELEKVAATVKAREEAQPKNLVTDDDVENFGEDMVDFQRRVATEVASKYEAELAELRTKLDQVSSDAKQTVGETKFDAQLHRLVPDFDAINADPKWVAWLDEVDPILRAPRRTLAQQAFESGDAEGVAYYVDLFKSVNNVEPPKEKPNKELESQIQPNRTTSSATPKGAPKVYTSAQISQMFKKAATLSSTNRIEEANKLEAEIDAAYMENRVRG